MLMEARSKMNRRIIAALVLALLFVPTTLYGGSADKDHVLIGCRDALLAHVAHLEAALPKMAPSP